MSGSGNTDSSAPISITAGWISYAAIAVVGVLSLFSLYMGFQNWSDDQQIAMMYMFIGSLGFASIGYMLFRSKAVSTQAKKELDIPKVEVVTTLECPKCNLKRVRDFKRGDYVFKSDEPCTRCDGLMVINRIHRKKTEKDIAKEKKVTEETGDV